MNSKKELWVLLASFVLPIVLGAGFFYWNPTAFTGNTINYGQFVNPLIATQKQDLNFVDKQGNVSGLWTLAYVTPQCERRCLQVLKQMKTARVLLNEDMRRMQRLLLTTGDTSIQVPELLVARPSAYLRQQLRKFPDNSLFLIDPLGNVMMHYDAKSLDIKRLLKDLKRLFKYSRVG